MKRLFASLFVLSASLPLAAQTIDYRFDDVRRSVTLATATHETAAKKGLAARSGDKVRTGWFSYALIASEQHRAKFEIFGSTDVELAGKQPGVLLTLNRGKLHAMFDKITGNEPRVVQTPGALLAVRGTQYTVTVDNGGQTQLDVFEGTVEVRSPLRPEPFLVHAGERGDFSRRSMPEVHPMPRRPDANGDDKHRAPGANDPRGTRPDGAPGDGGMRPGSGGGHTTRGGPPPPPPPGGKP
jgi:hypothetical protein